MLLYHPAFDVEHCIFRVLLLLSRMEQHAYELPRLRILDFYYLFPEYIERFKFTKQALNYRKRLKKPPDKYSHLQDPYRTFCTLEPFQHSALFRLASHNIIDVAAFQSGLIARSNVELPPELISVIDNAVKEDPDLVSFLTGPLAGMDLYGKDGLKSRSALYEYRYDPEQR